MSNEREARGGNEAVDLEAKLVGVGIPGRVEAEAEAVPVEPEEGKGEEQALRRETGEVRKSTG